MGRLILKNLSIGYGAAAVVKHFDLAVEDGEMVSLLGPSGVGKTTILKAIAGLVQPAAGQVIIDERPMNGLPPERRDAVMVFQRPLLFPFLDVFQNIAFGLRMRGRLNAGQKKRIREILALTGLDGMERRKVHELSGGQQQRVSLARALVLQPAVCARHLPRALPVGQDCRVRVHRQAPLLQLVASQLQLERVALLLRPDEPIRYVGGPG